MIALMLYGISLLIAVIAYFTKPLRLIGSALSLLIMGVSVGFVSASMPYVFGIIFLILGIYQMFNVARLIAGRLHAKHLKMAFFVGGGRLLVLQVIIYILGDISNKSASVASDWAILAPIVQVLASVVVFGLIVRQLLLSKPKNIDAFLSDKQLPTVSVLIPARNEDTNLIEILKSVVANDYPKLEILVLDDCSTTARIPEIVKEFAHDGVRFIQGDTPKDGWLPKNQAYETLANASSGEWLLFMGVDVRLGTGSIKSLVNYSNNHQKSMISVLPQRDNGTFWSGFFTPLRYFREMLRVTIIKPKVPALSTAWLIDKASYRTLGGIESVARKVVPEHYFANKLSEVKKYAFVRTNSVLQVSTAKRLGEQISTSIRVIYPSFHGRIEWSAISNIAGIFILFAPFVQLAYYVSVSNWDMAGLYLFIVCLLSSAHLLIVVNTNPVLWPLATINFPYLVIQEIILGFISMYRYEFGSVLWKERNICLPVMQVIPRLPKLEEPKSNLTGHGGRL